MNAALSDDPWSDDFDYLARIQLTKSILGHTEQTVPVQRALAALEGKTIDEILREVPE